MKRERIAYFDYFRGMAILMVVDSHCYDNWARDSIAEIAFANLITGATAIFVFISGFFFHYAFYKNFDYGKFMKTKTLNVFLPYLIISTLYLLARFAIHGVISFPISISEHIDLNNIFAYFMNIITGYTFPAYWYVPFIMCMFALSPFFIWYIQRSVKFQLGLMILFLCISAYVHRPTLNLNPLHSTLYLIGFYMLGILYSEHRDKLSGFFKKTTLVWVAASIIITIAMAYAGQVGNAHKNFPWTWNGIDWMVPLKFANIFAMLGICMNIEKYNIPILNYFAEISFGLFFMHQIVLILANDLYFSEHASGFLGTIALFIIGILVSVSIIFVVKKALGNKSRYIIGY